MKKVILTVLLAITVVSFSGVTVFAESLQNTGKIMTLNPVTGLPEVQTHNAGQQSTLLAKAADDEDNAPAEKSKRRESKAKTWWSRNGWWVITVSILVVVLPVVGVSASYSSASTAVNSALSTLP